MIKHLKATESVVPRLVVELPHKFVPVQSDEMQVPAQLPPPGPQKRAMAWLQSWVHGIGTGPSRVSPVIVDSPGLDSLFVKRQLLSILENRSCVYCYLIDVTKPAPFGNEGFEVRPIEIWGEGLASGR